MEGKNKKDLEWRFDLDDTQVNNFKGLVGLIVILHVIPNLNFKLGNEEKKFVEACYNGFGFEKNYNWGETIACYKRKREYSLTSAIYDKASISPSETPFEKLSEVMKGNDFTWAKIFGMIKKLDSYCYILFDDDFFNFKDLKPELKEKLKSESKDDFDKFKDDWKNDRKATRTNNRKNWIKKVNLEKEKVIKSRDDLNKIFTGIKKCLNDLLFLYKEEKEIIKNPFIFDCEQVFSFLFSRPFSTSKTEALENGEYILDLLVDLGFSFDYEKFIGDGDNVGEVIKAESTDPLYNEETVLYGFEKLVQNFNKLRNFDKSILWFDDKNKKSIFRCLVLNLHIQIGFVPLTRNTIEVFPKKI